MTVGYTLKRRVLGNIAELQRLDKAMPENRERQQALRNKELECLEHALLPQIRGGR